MKITAREPRRRGEKGNKSGEKNPEGNAGALKEKKKILANRHYIFRSSHRERQSDYGPVNGLITGLRPAPHLIRTLSYTMCALNTNRNARQRDRNIMVPRLGEFMYTAASKVPT